MLPALSCSHSLVWFRGNIQELKKGERWNVFKSLKHVQFPTIRHFWWPSPGWLKTFIDILYVLFFSRHLSALPKIPMYYQLSRQLFASQWKLFISSWQRIHPVGSFNWLFRQRPQHTDSAHASKNIKLGKWSILSLFVYWAKSSQIECIVSKTKTRIVLIYIASYFFSVCQYVVAL